MCVPESRTRERRKLSITPNYLTHTTHTGNIKHYKTDIWTRQEREQSPLGGNYTVSSLTTREVVGDR